MALSPSPTSAAAFHLQQASLRRGGGVQHFDLGCCFLRLKIGKSEFGIRNRFSVFSVPFPFLPYFV